MHFARRFGLLIGPRESWASRDPDHAGTADDVLPLATDGAARPVAFAKRLGRGFMVVVPADEDFTDNRVDQLVRLAAGHWRSKPIDVKAGSARLDECAGRLPPSATTSLPTVAVSGSGVPGTGAGNEPGEPLQAPSRAQNQHAGQGGQAEVLDKIPLAELVIEMTPGGLVLRRGTDGAKIRSWTWVAAGLADAGGALKASGRLLVYMAEVQSGNGAYTTASLARRLDPQIGTDVGRRKQVENTVCSQLRGLRSCLRLLLAEVVAEDPRSILPERTRNLGFKLSAPKPLAIDANGNISAEPTAEAQPLDR